MASKLIEAIAALEAADDRLVAALKRAYGKNTRDRRYHPCPDEPQELKDAREAYRVASRLHSAAWDEIHERARQRVGVLSNA